MPRKVDTRAGEIVPGDGPDFRLTRQEKAALPSALGSVTDLDLDRLASEVELIGQTYLSRRAQDETGPGRAEINKALRQLVNADDFVPALQVLNHAAESALLDALWLYHDTSWRNIPGVHPTFNLIEPLKRQDLGDHTTTAIRILRGAILNHLEDLSKKTGQKPQTSLTLAVDELLELFHHITGKRPTHSAKEELNHTKSVNSSAGKFVVQVVGLINLRLASAGEQKLPASRIFTEVRRGCERFRAAKPN